MLYLHLHNTEVIIVFIYRALYTIHYAWQLYSKLVNIEDIVTKILWKNSDPLEELEFKSKRWSKWNHVLSL